MDQSCIISYDIDYTDYGTARIECQPTNNYVLTCHCIHFDNSHCLRIIMEPKHYTTITFCIDMNDGDLGTVESEFKSLIGHYVNFIDDTMVKIEFAVRNGGGLNQINAVSMRIDIWDRTWHVLQRFIKSE